MFVVRWLLTHVFASLFLLVFGDETAAAAGGGGGGGEEKRGGEDDVLVYDPLSGDHTPLPVLIDTALLKSYALADTRLVMPFIRR